MNALVHSYYTRDAYYHVHADPWYHTRWLLDLGGSFAIWVGAVLYAIACFALAYKVRPAAMDTPSPLCLQVSRPFG